MVNLFLHYFLETIVPTERSYFGSRGEKLFPLFPSECMGGRVEA